MNLAYHVLYLSKKRKMAKHKKEAEVEITIEEIRRVEELVDRLVDAAKEYGIEMIHGYEEHRKNLLGIFLEDMEEQK